MSHNTYTLNNDGADAGSFHGAQNGFIYLGRGETATYQGPLTNLSFIEFYDSNPINTIAGASLVAGAAANWYKGFTVPAGTYYIEMSQHLQKSGTGRYIYQYAGLTFDNGTSRKAQVYHSQSTSMATDQNSQFPRTLVHAQTLSATSTINFQWYGFQVGSYTETPIRLSETQFVLIRKVA